MRLKILIIIGMDDFQSIKFSRWFDQSNELLPHRIDERLNWYPLVPTKSKHSALTKRLTRYGISFFFFANASDLSNIHNWTLNSHWWANVSAYAICVCIFARSNTSILPVAEQIPNIVRLSCLYAMQRPLKMRITLWSVMCAVWWDNCRLSAACSNLRRSFGIST